jgi:hypothetical protein
MKKLLPITNPELRKEWHPTRNTLQFEKVRSTSGAKAWWKCSRNPKHEWEARVYHRAVQGIGCPFCSGRYITFERSLAALFPEIAAEWHPTKNEPLKPEQVGPTSSKKIWWNCKNGHEWTSEIRNRTTYGTKCRECHAATHSLLTTHPDIALQWHPSKNEQLSPSTVTYGSQKFVWWKCNQGHEWQARINDRVRGSDCPHCPRPKISVRRYVSLGASFPELAKEWHPSLNSPLTADHVKPGSKIKVWWQCAKDSSHAWQSSVNNRLKGRGCPHCLRGPSLSTKFPDIAKEWHPTKNGELKPSDVSYGSARRVWWQCLENQSHEWESSVHNRTALGGVKKCPLCVGVGQSIIVAEKSLQTKHPDVAKEWHPTRNDNLLPAHVSRASGRKVWWKCSNNSDHEWEATVKNRTILLSGCPFCAENSRYTRFYEALYESAQANADFHKTFNKSIESLQHLSQQKLPSHLHLQQPYNRMMYASIITAMETYLCDAFFHKVTNDECLIEKLLLSTQEFKERKYAISDIIEWKKQTKKKVSDYLLDIVWHNLPKVEMLYKNVLSVVFPSDIDTLHKAISVRHDLIHRNGRSKSGSFHVIRTKDIGDLIMKVGLFRSLWVNLLHQAA